MTMFYLLTESATSYPPIPGTTSVLRGKTVLNYFSS